MLTTYAYKDFKKSGSSRSTEGGVKSAGKYHQTRKELCYSRDGDIWFHRVVANLSSKKTEKLLVLGSSVPVLP